MFYEIARMTTEQAIEVGEKTSERQIENERMNYINYNNDICAKSDMYEFFSELAHYINETGILGVTVTPEDLRIRETRESSDLIIEANLEPTEAEIVNNMIDDKRSKDE